MAFVHSLGDERSNFNRVDDDHEKPVEEDNPIWVTGAGVLEALDREYNAQRNNRENGRPEPEILYPYSWIVSDL
jgi:hypothetical protein